jgi:hypothetical protein
MLDYLSDQVLSALHITSFHSLANFAIHITLVLKNYFFRVMTSIDLLHSYMT